VEDANRDKRRPGEFPSRVVIAAPQGRSGKTSIAMGLCAALASRGFTVQTFKKGPDYIDPSWLTAVSGRPCRNLDPYFMPGDMTARLFQRYSEGADFGIIEGAMGLFDGIDLTGQGHTAWLAGALQAPILLVVNTQRMTYSVAALVSGFQHFEPGASIAGVILNNVSGSRHERKLTEAIEKHCGIPVLGAVPRDLRAKIAERHLGLIPFGEDETSKPAILLEQVAMGIASNLHIDGIVDIARAAPLCSVPQPADLPEVRTGQTRLGVFMDQVFSFYYPENLEALSRAGNELVYLNSLKDSSLSGIDGIYIGGGFPEFFAAGLENNRALRKNLARAVENGLPVYAECAGLMYLCRRMHWQGEWYEMAGVIPADVEMCASPQGHGYVEVEAVGDNPLFPAGMLLKGHEFHHSRLLWSKPLNLTYRVRRGHGVNGREDGITYRNLFASYTHLHAAAAPGWAGAFTSLLRKQKGRKLHRHIREDRESNSDAVTSL